MIVPWMRGLGLGMGWVACLFSSAMASDLVVACNALALDAIRFGNTPPPMAARQLAILHAAIFDAVNGIGRRYLSYRDHGEAPLGASPEAAVSAAANTVMRHLWPSFTPTFDAAFAGQTVSLPAGASKSGGIAWGRGVATDLLKERDFDGAALGVDYRSVTLPGHWEPTPPWFASPLLPQWPGVIPFALRAADQFRPAPPPALSSAEWAAQYEEVKSLGSASSRTRTPEQTEIAWFWADGVGTETPPGHWNRVAAQMVETGHHGLADSARVFALLNLALADAGIAAWEAKYVYDWWRPVTAIRAGDTDGNPATVSEPNWAPLIATPPFPEHVSGHSTFSAAAAAVLTEVVGSDRFTFTLVADGLFGATRSFLHFSDAALEAGQSRIYGGIHFQGANDEGQRLGHQVGTYVVRNFLLPAPSLRITCAMVNGSLEVRWPAGARLETSRGVAGENWVPVEGQGTASFPATDSRRFFRAKGHQ